MSCFDRNTLIKMQNGDLKAISDIIIGDILQDDSVITDTIKISSYGITLYELNNVIVSGIYRFYYDNMECIKILDHPNARIIDDYRENILYGLNTNTKVITIDNLVYLDWDDLDNNDIKKLGEKCEYLPKFIENKEIHKYLDNGFEENTLIELEIGTIVKIKDIEVNDILRFGERVLGVIEIDSIEIDSINEYYLMNNTKIICTKNIQISYENFYINTNNLEGDPINIEGNLYQLITDKGYYYIGGIKICDYNMAIERYLDNTEYYSQICY